MADETHENTTGPAGASSPQENIGGAPAAPQGAPLGTFPGGAPSSMPPATPAPDAPAPASVDARMSDDIQKILSGVKLPERRGQEGAKAPQKPAEIPISEALRNIDAPIPAPEHEQGAPAPEGSSGAKKSAVQSVHTLKQDLQQVVQTQKISLVRAAALEQEKPKTQPLEPARPSTHALRNTLFAVSLLLVLGGAALFGVYVVVQNKSTPLPAPTTTSIVFAEKTVSLQIDGQSPIALKQLLSEVRSASTASLGSITRIAPVRAATDASGKAGTRLATLSEFFTAIGAHPPDELMRALSDEFFFGFHTIDKNAPLLVIKVASYDRAFKGMLDWEQAMNTDLAPIYSAVPQLTLGADGLPTARTFTDVVMRNYDVRALKDDQGTVQMYYSFPTRDTLVIAESPYTFLELLSRLQATHAL